VRGGGTTAGEAGRRGEEGGPGHSQQLPRAHSMARGHKRCSQPLHCIAIGIDGDQCLRMVADTAQVPAALVTLLATSQPPQQQATPAAAPSQQLTCFPAANASHCCAPPHPRPPPPPPSHLCPHEAHKGLPGGAPTAGRCCGGAGVGLRHPRQHLRQPGAPQQLAVAGHKPGGQLGSTQLACRREGGRERGMGLSRTSP
jgi:hypothetical protein